MSFLSRMRNLSVKDPCESTGPELLASCFPLLNSTLKRNPKNHCCKRCHVSPTAAQWRVTFLMSLQTVEGAPKQIFPNLEELISKFEKPGQGLVVHLSNPVRKKSFCPRGRRVTSEPNVYGKSPDKGSGGTQNPMSTCSVLCGVSGNWCLALGYSSKELCLAKCNFHYPEKQHLSPWMWPRHGVVCARTICNERQGLSEKQTWTSFSGHVQSTHGHKCTDGQVFIEKKIISNHPLRLLLLHFAPSLLSFHL